jgi:penicillin-binding protein 1B
MKPFVYLAAFESGNYHINSMLKDQPIEITQRGRDEIWKPENYNQEFSGEMPLYRALALSKNVPTVHLGMEVGVDKVMNAVARSGLDKTPPAYPAMMLGSLSLSPLEVSQLYNTLANNGYRTPLRAVRAVLDENGEPLQRFALQVEEVITPEAVTQLNSLLHLVTHKGTARRLQLLIPDLALAGKTGTSNDYRDAWFAGFSGDLSTVVWVGNDDNSDTGLTGSSGALPIWAKLMRSAAQVPFATVLPDSLSLQQYEFETGYRMENCTQTENDVILPAREIGHAQELLIRCDTIVQAGPEQKQEPVHSKKKRSVLEWLKDRL